MTDLRAALADYLALRRALGYKLAADERLLRQFLRFMKANDATVITAALALKWATLPSGARPGWLAQRLSAVRLFAVFAASLDEATQVPPAGCPPIPSSPDPAASPSAATRSAASSNGTRPRPPGRAPRSC